MQCRGILQFFKRGLFILTATAMLTPGLYLPRTVASSETSVVSISGPSQNNSSGENLAISIIVEPGSAVAGVQFNLSFDPMQISIDNVEEGDFLSQNGASTYFIPGVIDNEAGEITGVAGAITSPGKTVASGGVFAIINLVEVTDNDDCLLDLWNVVVGDKQGNPLPISVIDGDIIINQSPVLDPIGDKTIDEGEMLTLTITAADPDGDYLSYSASNLPPGASFNPLTQKFSWTPDYDQSGAYTGSHFEVSDDSLFDYEDISITVNDAEPSYNSCDINGDGVVNVSDLIRITRHLGEKGQDISLSEDVNGDGEVNVLDIIQIVQSWTRGQSEYHCNKN